ncbi:hypothetical protein BDN70DRAFT_361192 [Pholiota conissans]|uniref:Uncharacterized protein n=1 Tax=Pholiota conissans TaxID=109636 RepID=A0A9P5YSB6_9AGAR|nr:hypothetical protein BDN70DRAFT_361192 [Pholiota conissans]
MKYLMGGFRSAFLYRSESELQAIEDTYLDYYAHLRLIYLRCLLYLLLGYHASARISFNILLLRPQH